MKPITRRTLNLLGLFGTAILLTGCVVSIGGSRHRNTPAPPSPPPPAPVVITESADAATIAEIDAAARLGFENNRTHVLAQIAERTALTTPVRVHLVNATYRSLAFDNSKVLILDKIIARPDFNDATRHAIVAQLGRLSFDNQRQHILQQINDRLKSAPAP